MGGGGGGYYYPAIWASARRLRGFILFLDGGRCYARNLSWLKMVPT